MWDLWRIRKITTFDFNSDDPLENSFLDKTLCLCGENKEFKKCCKNKSYDELSQNIQLVYKRLQTNNTCYMPDCQRKTISCHSISKQSSLLQLAESRKVYGFTKNAGLYNDYIKILSQNPYKLKSYKYTLEKLGIVKEASVFSGFCEYHDNMLFECLEKSNRFTMDEKQLFMLSFRALAHTYSQRILDYKMDIYFRHMLNAYKLNNNEYYEIIRKQNDEVLIINASLVNRFKSLLKVFMERIIHNNYSGVYSTILKFSTKLPLQASTGFFPKNRNDINNINCTPEFVSLISSNKSSYAIYSKCNFETKILDSENTITNYYLNNSLQTILNLMLDLIYNSENIYLSPKWLDSVERTDYGREIKNLLLKIKCHSGCTEELNALSKQFCRIISQHDMIDFNNIEIKKYIVTS